MWQSSLTPPRVEETNSGILISHIGRCCFNLSAMYVRLQGCFFPVGLYEVMDSSHGDTSSQSQGSVAWGLCRDKGTRRGIWNFY